MSAHVVASPCPACGRVMDRAQGIEGERSPRPGDWTLCAGCGEVLVFGLQRELRRPTPEEIASLTPDDVALLSRARTALDLIWEEKPELRTRP